MDLKQGGRKAIRSCATNISLEVEKIDWSNFLGISTLHRELVTTQASSASARASKIIEHHSAAVADASTAAVAVVAAYAGHTAVE